MHVAGMYYTMSALQMIVLRALQYMIMCFCRITTLYGTRAEFGIDEASRKILDDTGVSFDFCSRLLFICVPLKSPLQGQCPNGNARSRPEAPESLANHTYVTEMFGAEVGWYTIAVKCILRLTARNAITDTN